MLSAHDIDNLNEIRTFLNSQNIDFEEYTDEYDFSNKLDESMHSYMPLTASSAKAGDLPAADDAS